MNNLIYIFLKHLNKETYPSILFIHNNYFNNYVKVLHFFNIVYKLSKKYQNIFITFLFMNYENAIFVILQ